MNNTVRDTTKNFARCWGVDYPLAQNFIRLLASKGIAQEDGDDKVAGTKGKGSIYWVLPATITFNLVSGEISR